MAGEALNLDPRTVEIGPCDIMEGQIVFSGADTLAKGTLLGTAVAGDSAGDPIIFVPYASGGADGAQIITAVLGEAVSVTGAATVVVRPIVGGKVNQELLVVDAVGAPTPAELVAMAQAGIYPVPCQELGAYDNAL